MTVTVPVTTRALQGFSLITHLSGRVGKNIKEQIQNYLSSCFRETFFRTEPIKIKLNLEKLKSSKFYKNKKCQNAAPKAVKCQEALQDYLKITSLIEICDIFFAKILFGLKHISRDILYAKVRPTIFWNTPVVETTVVFYRYRDPSKKKYNKKTILKKLVKIPENVNLKNFFSLRRSAA